MFPTQLSGASVFGESDRTNDEALELDRMPGTPDAGTCSSVPCAACGRPHVAELPPPIPSICEQCVEAAQDSDDPYIEYGGSD